LLLTLNGSKQKEALLKTKLAWIRVDRDERKKHKGNLLVVFDSGRSFFLKYEMTKLMTKIGFIGAGKVGTALAVQLSGKGYSVVAVASRTKASAEKLAGVVRGCKAYDVPQSVADNSELVFITTPDDAIDEVATQVKWNKSNSVVHCSGAGSLNILEPARQAGADIGAIHPLQSFANVEQAIKNIPGSTFAIEGDGPIVDLLKGIATGLDGKAIELSAGNKVLYHAAAVVACNYFVTLMKLTTDIWQGFGVNSNDAIEALSPLLQGTVNNLINVGLPNCLTGPIARGDVGTINKHVEAFSEKMPEMLKMYCELGLKTIPIGLAKGTLNSEKAEELRKILEG
jgi:predicted short-subunit dehydrogenase-like oxidoreductase (DUF2520 family)